MSIYGLAVANTSYISLETAIGIDKVMMAPTEL